MNREEIHTFLKMLKAVEKEKNLLNSLKAFSVLANPVLSS
jgi:hypothetical protein